ncbi:ABC-type polysaccharide/polyol phosphate export system, permease component [Longilinea arvoryzae]|uniref:Transport permease protein n=1 Tax=Longilinea arvoryzae TaxID=360412 RepID=A0A0S7BI39_9CHLR|nr:ABC transporter permease [Longilinea arvoryzae]GAP13461.1 ABC-type polysaccharide/polyol phosphate export system, permease component [Longilinea arvoryzae]
MTAYDLKHDFPAAGSQMTTVIQATHGWASLGLHDIWEYRELLYLLVWREIRGMYRQTALGASWLFLRPILNVVVLTVVFGVFVKVPSNDLPYALFSMSALLPWTYFSNAVLRSAGSLVQNMEIISKVYFPRVIIAIAGVLSGLVDLAASFIVFLGFMVYFKLPLRIEMLWLPAFILASILLALTVGLWLATLSVRYRDVSFAVNFILQAVMYLSPVIYPISSVPEKLVFLYQMNPMAGIIEGFRWSLLGAGSPPGTTFWISLGIMLILLVLGAFVFRRTERTIVDVL